MLAHAVVFVAHALVLAATTPNAGADVLSRPVLDDVAGPLLTSAQFLIPSAVAISGIHKMMENRESGGSFLVDMVTKGGVAGAVLDTIGHKAAIVDANVANPDAWGVLNLPMGAATVRDTIAALSANAEPSRPVFATTPALACYPESRDSSEYSRHDIRLLAEHLRRNFTVAVIDLSNRLPDPTGGPEAAAAAYWLEVADAVVLPTAWSKQDFNGVLDYLELPDLPPAVVAYIAPRARRHREHPLTQRYVDAIALRARAIIELPDEADNVRYAGMAGVPLDSVSRRLRSGYRALTQAVVLAAGAAR